MTRSSLRVRAGDEIDPLAGLRFDRPVRGARAARARRRSGVAATRCCSPRSSRRVPTTCRSNPSSSRGGRCSASTSARRWSSRSPSLVADVNLLAGAARRRRRAERGGGARARRAPRDERARPRPVSADHGDLLGRGVGAASASKRSTTSSRTRCRIPELTGRAAANEVEHRKAEATAPRRRDDARARTHRDGTARIRAHPDGGRPAAACRAVRTDARPQRRPGDASSRSTTATASRSWRATGSGSWPRRHARARTTPVAT